MRRSGHHHVHVLTGAHAGARFGRDSWEAAHQLAEGFRSGGDQAELEAPGEGGMYHTVQGNPRRKAASALVTALKGALQLKTMPAQVRHVQGVLSEFGHNPVPSETVTARVGERDRAVRIYIWRNVGSDDLLLITGESILPEIQMVGAGAEHVDLERGRVYFPVGGGVRRNPGGSTLAREARGWAYNFGVEDARKTTHKSLEYIPVNEDRLIDRVLGRIPGAFGGPELDAVRDEICNAYKEGFRDEFPGTIQRRNPFWRKAASQEWSIGDTVRLHSQAGRRDDRHYMVVKVLPNNEYMLQPSWDHKPQGPFHGDALTAYDVPALRYNPLNAPLVTRTVSGVGTISLHAPQPKNAYWNVYVSSKSGGITGHYAWHEPTMIAPLGYWKAQTAYPPERLRLILVELGLPQEALQAPQG